MNTPSPKQHFTLEEANQRLPLVKRIVEDIVRMYHEIYELRKRLADIRQRSGSFGSLPHHQYVEEADEMEDRVIKETESFKEVLNELEVLGIELKDPEKGLIDFRSMKDGREVYLCWHLGEDEICYWHELDAGFSGRQSLLETSTHHSHCKE